MTKERVEEALRFLAKANGKTIEEMRAMLDDCGDYAIEGMKLWNKARYRMRLLANKVSPLLKSDKVFVVVIDAEGVMFSELDNKERWEKELQLAKKRSM